MRIFAPFSEDIVRRLNGYQKFALAHPYTCPQCKDTLIATESGLYCKGGSIDPLCDYSQNWALDPPTDDDLVHMQGAFEAWKESKT